MSLCRKHFIRISPLMLAVLVLLLPSLASPQEAEQTTQLLIMDFENLGEKPSRLDVLEQTIPHVLRASLQQYHWLGVVLINDLKGAGTESEFTRQNLLADREFLKSRRIRFTLSGKLIQIQDKIRVDVTLKDLDENSPIPRKFVVFGENSILTDIKPLSEYLIEHIEKRSPKASQADVSQQISIAIERFFDHKTENQDDNPFGEIFPSSIFSQLSLNRLAQAKQKNISLTRFSAEEVVPPADAHITGEYVMREDKIEVVVTVKISDTEQTRIQVNGTISAIRELLENLNNRVLEVIKGQITPEGVWEPVPILYQDPEAKVEEYLAEGKRAYDATNYDLAVLMYRQAIEGSRDDPAAHLGLADAFLAQGNSESAIPVYEKVVELKPQPQDMSVAAHNGLGRAYFRTNNDGAKGEFEEALKLASEDSKQRFASYRGLGDVYLLKRNYTGAIANYELAKDIDPDRPDIHKALGQAYLLNDQPDEAIDTFEAGMKMFPENRDFINSLAVVYNRKGRRAHIDEESDEALKAFEETIKLESADAPLRAEAYLYAGRINAEASDPEAIKQRIEYLGEAISLDPNNDASRRVLGVAYREDKQYGKSIETLKDAITVKPTSLSYSEMSQTYRDMKQFPLAIESLEQASRLDPESRQKYDKDMEDIRQEGVQHFSQASRDHQDEGEYQLAIDSLKKVSGLDPANKLEYKKKQDEIRKDGGQALFGKSEVHFQNKAYTRAVERLNEAIGLDPANKQRYEERLGEIRSLAGDIFSKEGENHVKRKAYKLAIESLNQANAIDPERKQERTSTLKEYERLKKISETAPVSLVVPGLGQYLQRHRKRRLVVFGAAVGAGTAAFLAYRHHQNTLDDYLAIRSSIVAGPVATSDVLLKEKQVEAHDKAKSARDLAKVTQIALVGVWGYNVWDAGVTHSAPAISFIAPGLGQYLQGRRKRAIIVGPLTVGVGAAAFLAYRHHQNTLDDYLAKRSGVTAGNGVAEKLARLEPQTEAHGTAKRASYLAIATQLALVGVWGYNVWDAKRGESIQIEHQSSLEPQLTADGGRIVVNIEF